ncbi:MAG: urease accessory protein UreD, partial [Pseudomonadota bacterium]
AACFGPHRAAASLLLVSPDAEDRLDAARRALPAAPAEAGASAWNGLLTARFLAPSAAELRRALLPVLAALDITPLPRVWQC